MCREWLGADCTQSPNMGTGGAGLKLDATEKTIVILTNCIAEWTLVILSEPTKRIINYISNNRVNQTTVDSWTCKHVRANKSRQCFNTIYLRTFYWYGKHTKENQSFSWHELCAFDKLNHALRLLNSEFLFRKNTHQFIFTTLSTAIFSQWGMSTCRNSECLLLEWTTLREIYTRAGLIKSFLWAVGRSVANEVASKPVAEAEGIPDWHSTSNSWSPLHRPPPIPTDWHHSLSACYLCASLHFDGTSYAKQ